MTRRIYTPGRHRNRLCLVGPMTGLPEFNYPAFARADAQLAAAGYVTVNPADRSGPPAPGEERQWHEYVRESLAGLLSCDGVATLTGWRSSEGARLEVTVAQGLHMPVKPVTVWVALAREKAEGR